MIANHTFAGTVQAVQYTGSNLSEIATALGTGWHIYTCAASNFLVIYQASRETFPGGGAVISPTDWLVSDPAYGTSTASLVNNFQVVSNSNFTQQYA